MNKKIAIILISLLFTSILLYGCLEETKPIDKDLSVPTNLNPIGVIFSPEKAYFGETIVFDGSGSYDSDGEIVLYNWDFGDDETAEGAIVKHTYKFENNFTIDYPLIYTINLFIKDDGGSLTALKQQIKVYPREYKFYLSSQKLTIEKPDSDYDKIRGSGLLKVGSPQELTYTLDSFIIVNKCTWNATVYLEKPLFTWANKMSIILYDNEGNEIVKKDERLGPSNLWMEKTVQIKGIFDKEEEFKTIKILVNGFSFRKTISIMYGGEKPSNICFDFTT